MKEPAGKVQDIKIIKKEEIASVINKAKSDCRLPMVLCVVGPTASGKTKFAIELAKAYNGCIVSCDSMQIYRYMDIGTAKATKEERAEVPHYMVDFADPNTDYSVADFSARAKDCINDILSKNKLPILCGGTGLYMDSIVNSINFDSEKRDDVLRQELEQTAKKDGAEAIYKVLVGLDPKEAEKIHPNNVKRVIRAIEICKTTGMTKTEADKKAIGEPEYNAVYFGLTTDREILYERINKRVDEMIKDGLEDEVKSLLDMGVRRNSTAMQAIGYKEMIKYIDNTCTLEETTEDIKRESRRYAKRQLTWFRRNKNINWIEI